MRDDSGALTGPTAIRLTGPLAEQALPATLALLEGVGVRATAVGSGDDAAVAARLAAAGLVTVATGEGGTGSAVTIDAPRDEAPEDVARRALAAVDHGLEVASRPIFVVGGGRSGTTWVLDLLSSHPRVAGLFETLILAPEYLGMLHRRADFSPDRTIGEERRAVGLGQIARREEVVAAMRPVLTRFLSRAVGPEHDFVVEKTPSQVESLPAIADLFPEAHVIHVVRDVRDVIVSRRAAERAGWHPRRKTGRVHPPHAVLDAREWVFALGDVDTVRDRLPVLDVSYEELHADSDATLARMLAFCGIPADPGLVHRIAEANAFSRLPRTGESLFRRGGRVGDWRTALPRHERLFAEAVAGERLAERGYSPGPGAAYRAARVAQRLRGRGRAPARQAP